MIKVVLVGSGNVAYHMHRAMLKAPGISLLQLVARRPEALSEFDTSLPRTGLEGPLEQADVIVLAVSDTAIGEVARKLPGLDALMVHTSGASGVGVLGNQRKKAVMYPLQTFSKQRELTFQEVPLIIESERKEDSALLHRMASALSNTVVELNTLQRKYLHLAAVFLNNFSNHMVYLGESICQEQEIPMEILHPLIRETWAKLETLSAREAQTGPARRGDGQTQREHLGLLADSSKKELYKKISDSIANTYDQEL